MNILKTVVGRLLMLQLIIGSATQAQKFNSKLYVNYAEALRKFRLGSE